MSHRQVLLFAFAVCVFFQVSSASGQNDNIMIPPTTTEAPKEKPITAPEPTPEAQPSFSGSPIPRQAELVTEMMERISKAGLECRRCSISAALAAPDGGSNVEMVLGAQKIDDLRQFLKEISGTWRTEILKLGIKPSGLGGSQMTLEIILGIHLFPVGSSSGDILDGALGPVAGFPFFDISQGPSDRVTVFGFTFEKTKPVSFQLVSKEPAPLFALAGSKGFPERSRTVSRSRFLSGELYTLDFSSNQELFKTGELIDLFKVLAQVTNARELTVQDAPDGSQLFKASVLAAPDELPAIWQKLAGGGNFGFLKCEANIDTLSTPSKWNCTFLFLPGGGAPVQAEKTQTPVSDLVGALGAPWPEAVKSFLTITWTPSKISVQGNLETREQADSVETVAASLGLSPTESSGQDKTDDGKTVFRWSGARPGGVLTSGLDVFKGSGEFMGFGEVLENAPSKLGQRTVLRFEPKDLPKLFQYFEAQKTLSLVEFSATAEPGKPIRAEFVQIQGGVGSLEIYRLMKTVFSVLPWNQPDSALEKGYILTSVKIPATGDLEFKGITLKNKYIFSLFFPSLKLIRGIGEPFFTEGKYSDHVMGRLMTFKVTAPFTPQR